MKLSILIPTTLMRKHFLDALLADLERQLGAHLFKHGVGTLTHYTFKDAEIIIDHTERDRIGKKRNRLLQAANGKYVCFFDDDDTPGETYISVIMRGIDEDVDCVALRGVMTVDGNDPQVFEHSIRYNRWATRATAQYPEVKFERMPNHLNAVRATIAKRIKFPEINHAEDHAWSRSLQESGLVRTEFFSQDIIYYYKYRTKK